MHVVRVDDGWIRLATALMVCAGILTAREVQAQGGRQGPGGAGGARPGGPQAVAPVDRTIAPQFFPQNSVQVAQLQIVGNETISESKVRSYLQTREQRPYDPERVQADVRRLLSAGLFRDVRTYTKPTPSGMTVTFEVFERPVVRYVRFVGNRKIKDKFLDKEAGLKVGDAMNAYAVDEARRKVEELYHSRGFPRAKVSIIEGDQPRDRGVAFLINEGNLEKIRHVNFVGNTIATDARLRTQIQSKSGLTTFWMFQKGRVDRQKIDEDVERLTAYYRNLGYFGTRVGRELNFDDSGKWLTLTFVVDEGPRYSVENVSFVGNEKYSSEQLTENLELKAGTPFDMRQLNRDTAALRDLYGTEGHIFADIKADPRFLEEPGRLHLVYDIREGEQYRVGQINVRITGDHPHTRRSVVLARLSFQPGDIINIREIRDSERRLKSSQLFLNEPARNISPQVVVKPPELQDLERGVAKQRTAVRGQSPDAPFVPIKRLPPTMGGGLSRYSHDSGNSDTHVSSPPQGRTP